MRDVRIAVKHDDIFDRHTHSIRDDLRKRRLVPLSLRHGPEGEHDLPEDVELPDCDGVLCQLEIPLVTVEHVANTAPGDFFLNAAPARGPVPAADVTIVNRYELEALTHREGVIAVTLGAEGAILMENGKEVARAKPPPVTAVDGTTRSHASLLSEG